MQAAGRGDLPAAGHGHRAGRVAGEQTTNSNIQHWIYSVLPSQIVIDSIAALARKEALGEREKESYFLSQAAGLKKLAEMCSCVVLATNQVLNTALFALVRYILNVCFYR